MKFRLKSLENYFYWFFLYKVFVFFQIILQWLLILREMYKTCVHRNLTHALVSVGFIDRVTGLWDCRAGSHTKLIIYLLFKLQYFGILCHESNKICWNERTWCLSVSVYAEWLCTPKQIFASVCHAYLHVLRHEEWHGLYAVLVVKLARYQ